MVEEIWEDISGYEGIYKISNLGNIKSLERIDARGYRRKEKYRRTVKNSDGYLIVGLRKCNVERKFSVHRLVAEHFIENPYNYLEVNHKDENKENNCAQNLEWCNHKYNMHYTQERHPNFMICSNPKKRDRKINQYSLDGILIKQWNSVMEIKRKTGLNPDSIWSCCKRGHRSQGYIWDFAN